ncbi:MAG: ketose-bisphosphate aldolase [Actinobacteria bacterium]|nr:ketose-bisphosphate aldolase [Actinomycetota bacterium]
MPLVPLAEILDAARDQGYCVPGFTIDNLEIVAPLIEAGETERSPVVIQAGPVGLDHAGWETLAAVVATRAGVSSVPIALHLDHGSSIEQAHRAIDAGFTSVMIDGSSLDERSKLDLTVAVVRSAHESGASVEAELGPIAGSEEGVSVSDADASLTDPGMAERFVEQTGIDALAVSVGNVHWVSDSPPVLDFGRLRLLRDAVPVPLVLHGGSGVAREDLPDVVRCGVTKLNIAFNVNRAFVAGLREGLAATEIETVPGRRRCHPHRALAAAKGSVREAARAEIVVLGSSNRA